MTEVNRVSDYVVIKINNIFSEKDTGIGKALLARLRRGVGKNPGELPELWGVFLENMPEKWMRQDGIPTKEEWAIYISLTIFALHQQGRENNMHKKGQTLGKAIRKLVENQDDEERILRRFNPLITAIDMPEASHYLRGLVQLLASKNIPLDYGRLAYDLLQFQSEKERMKVQLRWGQDFYRMTTNIEEGEEP